MTTSSAAGPLSGVRVLEFEGLGPAPFCGMLLADMGAEVALLERPGASLSKLLLGEGRQRVTHRGKRSLGIDLKHPAAPALVLRILKNADVLIEGFRPGVMERLGLGPEPCLEQNPGLVYARMTGWGQTGPLAETPGHDLNFTALSGALSAGRWHGGAPWAPPTLVGDMGGGGLMLAFGIACALFEARRSGLGQIIDASMAEGAALLAHGLYNVHAGRGERPGTEHLLDSSAPFYDVYRCADGRWLSVAPLEPSFFASFVGKLGLSEEPDFHPSGQFDPDRWPRMHARLEGIFAAHDRDHWCSLFEGSSACVAPVLEVDEAPDHPQHQARNAFLEIAGVRQPAPAPRLSRTPSAVRREPPLACEHTRICLEEFGLSRAEIEDFVASNVVQCST